LQVLRDIGVPFPSLFGAGAYCEPIYLERLSQPEIADALRSHAPHVREAICRLAQANPRFYDIAARPSLLQLVASIWDEPEMAAAAQSLTSADVMGAFVHSTHRRQSDKEERPGEFMLLNEAERVYFMGGIALHMLANRDTTIDARQLGELTDRLRLAMPDTLAQSGGVAHNRYQPLRIRNKRPAHKRRRPCVGRARKDRGTDEQPA
jgi:hypothetical protein